MKIDCSGRLSRGSSTVQLGAHKPPTSASSAPPGSFGARLKIGIMLLRRADQPPVISNFQKETLPPCFNHVPATPCRPR
jgi:hypothetical protein